MKLINEAKRMQQLAGLLKEDSDDNVKVLNVTSVKDYDDFFDALKKENIEEYLINKDVDEDIVSQIDPEDMSNGGWQIFYEWLIDNDQEPDQVYKIIVGAMKGGQSVDDVARDEFGDDVYDMGDGYYAIVNSYTEQEFIICKAAEFNKFAEQLKRVKEKGINKTGSLGFTDFSMNEGN